MKVYLIVAMFLLIKPDCSGQKNHIVFGKGGGISGQVAAFKLMGNGKVLKGSGIFEIDYNASSKIKKSETKKLFNEINDLQIDTFSKPGNMYYFITFWNEGVELKYTWGAAGFDPPLEIIAVYHKMMNSFNGLSYKNIKK